MNKESNHLRTLARISGIAGIMVFIVYLFLVVFPGLLEIEDPNTTADTSMLGFLILGYFFAWFREYEGGIMLMFISIIAGLSYFYQDTGIHPAVLLAVCIPLLLSGLLFALHHYRKNRHSKEDQ